MSVQFTRQHGPFSLSQFSRIYKHVQHLRSFVTQIEFDPHQLPKLKVGHLGNSWSLF